MFSLNMSKPSDLVFSFASTVRTIKSHVTLKLAVGLQNILRKNPLSVVSLVSLRERGVKPACNQWRLLVVSNPGGILSMLGLKYKYKYITVVQKVLSTSTSALRPKPELSVSQCLHDTH